MKKIILIGLLFLGNVVFAKGPSMDEVRILYQKAATDENACKKLIEILTPFENDALYSGYRASAIMMMAKHVFNPFSKMSYFKSGKRTLEKSIEADSKNVELRFLRFTAQSNIPSFLGYHDRIESDKKFILNSISLVTDLKLKEFMIPILRKSNHLTSYEKQELK